MPGLTDSYDWETLNSEEHGSTQLNLSGIKKIKRQAVVKGVRRFEMSLTDKGMADIPGIVLSYWGDLDKAFNTSYPDVAMKLIDRALLNRGLMSSRVLQLSLSRQKFDQKWCYEWEDCHTRAFLLERRDEAANTTFRSLNQLRAKLSGAARSRNSAAMKKNMASKKRNKKTKPSEEAKTVISSDGIETIDLTEGSGNT